MRSPSEHPCVVGVFPAPFPVSPSSPAAKIWPDLENLVAMGEWHPGELRSIVCAEGRLVLIGQCPVDDDQASRELATALRAGRPQLVMGWPGSYQAIIITREALVAFTDLAGQYPLYYHQGHRVVFGTSPLPTASAAGMHAELDVEVAAAEIFCAMVPALVSGRTPISGLRKLEPGEALRVSADGVSTTWTYDALEQDQRLTVEECASRLSDALTAAVSWRMASGEPVSADFSGGLDSTSVAFLAVRCRQESLPVFVYHHPDAAADDLGHAVSNARLNSLLRLNVVTGTKTSLAYQDLASAASTELPDFAAAVHQRNHLRLRHAAASGSRVHLGGEGADALVVAPPSYLGDLASRRHLRRLLADAGAWALQRNEAQARVVYRAVRLARTSMRQAFRGYARQLQGDQGAHPDWIDAISWWPGPGLESRWLTGRARRTLVELLHRHADLASRTSGSGVADLTAKHDLYRSGAVQRQVGHMGRSHGVWPQAPFLDNDVIRVCTSLPAHRRADGTMVKPLLRAAMQEAVPTVVLARGSKGNYIAEDYLGARLAGPELRTRLGGSPLAELGLIEPRAVIDSLHRAAMGVAAPFPALNRLIAYDLWLRSIG